MRQKILLSFLVLFISLVFTSGHSQDVEYYRAGQIDQVESIKPTHSGKSFLWKVGSGLKPSYILGSLHFAKPQMYPLAPIIDESFDASDVLVVEINILAQDPVKMQMLLTENGTYPYGESLEKNLSNRTLSLLNDKLASLNIDISAVNGYKPWYLALNLVTMDLLRLGFNPMYGIDLHFMKKAQGNKAVDQLESLRYQIDLFNDLSAHEQELFLLSTLIDLEIAEKEVDSMTEAWETGDINRISSILGESLERNPELAPIYDKVIYKRNYEMADKIASLLQSGRSYFFIIGSAHLVGKEGIIELLKEKGYSLEQL